MITGIIRTKAFAVILGTFGVGIISQLMNFYSFVLLVCSIGIPLGLTKYVSEWEKDGLWDDIRLIIGQSNTLLVLSSIFILIITSIFAKRISSLLFQDESYFLLIIFLTISIPFTLIGVMFDAFIKGLKKFSSYLLLSIFTSFLSLTVTIFLVTYLKILGAVIALTCSALLNLICYIWYFKKTKLLKLSNFFSLNFKYSLKFKFLVRLAFAYLLIGSVEVLSQLVIRAFIIKYIGINDNGLYQTVYSLSMSYFNVLFMSLGIYLLPILSSINDRNLANEEINNTLRLTFILIVPLICFIFIFRNFLILTLYSKVFLPSASLMFFSFLGDYFRAFSGVIGTWLVPNLKIKAWIIFSLVYYLLLVSIFLILLNIFQLGLKSVVISYLISNITLAILNLYFIYKRNNFRFSKINAKLFPFSFFIILITLIISNFNIVFGYFLIIPIIIIWFKLTITMPELLNAYNFIKNKIKN